MINAAQKRKFREVFVEVDGGHHRLGGYEIIKVGDSHMALHNNYHVPVKVERGHYLVGQENAHLLGR